MRWHAFVACVVLVGILAASSTADIPQEISYQGVLNEADGTPVPDASYNLTFRLYDVPTGGSAVWSQAHTVPVEDGIFNVYLGPFDLDWSITYWLGISVGGDPELVPRVQLASAPYAFYASQASYAEETTTDWDWERGPTNIWRMTGSVGIGTSTPGEKLDVNGMARVVGFQMPTGAMPGYVLTSNVEGTGSWQPAAGTIGGGGTTGRIPVFTGPTTLGNSVITQSGIAIGIGTTTPSPDSQLHVDAVSSRAGYFETDAEAIDVHVIHAEYTGGEPERSATAVYGKVDYNDTWGTGGYFTAAQIGVKAYVLAPADGGWHSGLSGTASGGNGENIGVYGSASASEVGTPCYGVRGYAFDGGNASDDATNYGVYGKANAIFADNYGVYARAEGAGSQNYGVYASVPSTAGWDWAGYFVGNVNVTGTVSKGGGSFTIDHPLDPENKYLRHSFVESPDMMNVYNGNVVLDGAGAASIELPEWFGVLNRDFRYQLTCIGGFAPVYVAEEISGNRFRIAGGEPGMKVSWQVTGVRQDKFAEEHRIVVEEDKPDGQRGRYLYPELYGMPRSAAVNYHEEREEPPVPDADELR